MAASTLPPRERNPVGWALGLVLALLLVGGGVAGAWLYARSDYRVEIASPRAGALVTPQFRVDVLVAGQVPPAELVLMMDGQVVGAAEVTEADWRAPGSATVRGLSAKVPPGATGYKELTVHAVGLVPREAVSEPIEVWVQGDAEVPPAAREDVAAVRRVLARDLPKAAVALDSARRRSGDAWTLDEAYRAARERVFEAAIPTEVGARLRELFGALETEPAERVGLAADRVGAALAQAGLPLWLTLMETRYRDGSPPRSFLMSYELDAPMQFDLAGDTIPAHLARRIDDLNVRERLLGHRTTGIAQAVVLVDRVAATAGELGACLHAGARRCLDRDLIHYTELDVPDSVLEALLRGLRDEVDQAFPDLCGVDPDACTRAVHRLLVRSIGHHEVRHVRDHRRGLRLAQTLARRLDRLVQAEVGNLDLTRLEARLDLERRAYQTMRGANAEFSAYLAQLAEGDGLRRFVLLQLLSFAASPWFEGTDEHAAALALFASLGRGLGLLDADADDRAARDHLNAVAGALAVLSAADLGRLAADAYARELGDYRPAAPVSPLP